MGLTLVKMVRAFTWPKNLDSTWVFSSGHSEPSRLLFFFSYPKQTNFSFKVLQISFIYLFFQLSLLRGWKWPLTWASPCGLSSHTSWLRLSQSSKMGLGPSHEPSFSRVKSTSQIDTLRWFNWLYARQNLTLAFWSLHKISLLYYLPTCKGIKIITIFMRSGDERQSAS